MEIVHVHFKLDMRSEEVRKVYCTWGFLLQWGLVGLNVRKV